jgi:hypothetical protein
MLFGWYETRRSYFPEMTTAKALGLTIPESLHRALTT